MTKPPPLRNDCFAMPRGVHWTPVKEALQRLDQGLSCVVSSHSIKSSEALGEILAEDVFAQADHPPFANSAVDGYGFCFSDLPKTKELCIPVIAGRAAAGEAFAGTVPKGHAIRILTGAAMPVGVDTVILEEDVNFERGNIYFNCGLKQGANSRPKAEDISLGQVLFKAGHKLRAVDLGVLASGGVAEVSVYERLKVGIISTGSELTEVGSAQEMGQIYDANRPMLVALLKTWGYDTCDCGHLSDDEAVIKDALDKASLECDVILTTGGASAGDEDHISRLLKLHGDVQNWRIALKPGRPLALALWNGTPIFGLPGNPVAALVCTVIFAFPAFAKLSGRGWLSPTKLKLPASFQKTKKQGRQEFLRARLNSQGTVEIFQSEGSGRISSLSWAEGLVCLNDDAQEIKHGDLIDYLPLGLLTELNQTRR